MKGSLKGVYYSVDYYYGCILLVILYYVKGQNVMLKNRKGTFYFHFLNQYWHIVGKCSKTSGLVMT